MAGKFKFDPCGSCCPLPGLCQYCEAEGTPDSIEVTIAGITGAGCTNYNGTFVCDRLSGYPYYDCVFQYVAPGGWHISISILQTSVTVVLVISLISYIQWQIYPRGDSSCEFSDANVPFAYSWGTSCNADNSTCLVTSIPPYS